MSRLAQRVQRLENRVSTSTPASIARMSDDRLFTAINETIAADPGQVALLAQYGLVLPIHPEDLHRLDSSNVRLIDALIAYSEQRLEQCFEHDRPA